jgi:Neocarzinostatin family
MAVKSPRHVVRGVVAAGVMVLGLVLVSLPTANATPPDAAEPSATVTPSTGLRDGEIVQLTASGLSPNTVYEVDQCGEVEAFVYACNEAEAFTVETDATGTVQPTPIRVRQTFEGSVDSVPWGKVDCTVQVCGIGVGDVAGVEISFA